MGDAGAILDLLASDGRIPGDPDAAGTRCIVENVAADGTTVWLAEFARVELELVSRPRTPRNGRRGPGVMRTDHAAPGPATGIEVTGDMAGRFALVALTKRTRCPP